MPPPQQKPTAPTLPVDSGWCSRNGTAAAMRCAVSSGIERGDHVAALVLVGRRAAERRQHVDREAEKAFEREPPRDVLDVRIEPAVLVDDDHRRTFSLRLEPRQIAADARACAS